MDENEINVVEEEVTTAEETTNTEEVVELTPEQIELQKQIERLVQGVEYAIQSLVPIQKSVNDSVKAHLSEDKEFVWEDYAVAYNVELYEAINSLQKYWKWWKKSAVLDKNTVLDEVADCFAFILSIFLTFEEEQRNQMIKVFANRYFEIKLSINFNEREKVLKDIIYLIGTSSELKDTQHLNTLDSFCLLLIAVEVAFDDVDWDDFLYYYKKKSKVNLQRQQENY